MEKIPFKLEADYAPAGDQPEAIEQLVEGLGEGLAHQTLLGVTGSGKSVGHDDPLLIAHRSASGRLRTQLVHAGPFIDELIASHGLQGAAQAETERFACADRGYFTLAYDPRRGTTGWHPVAALLRHRAPGQMFRVTTECGRSVQATGDHNFWVLRAGALALVRTEEVRAGDCLPVPDQVLSPSEERAPPLSDGGGKRGRAARQRGGEKGARSAAARLDTPAREDLEAVPLAATGTEHAGTPREGSARVPGTPAPGASTALHAGAGGAQLPALATVLRTYFDSAGAVDAGRGEVSASTASAELASDLAYALKRFAIHAQIRQVQRPDADVHVVISGRLDLERYAAHVGFDHPDKRACLREVLATCVGTRADGVPILPGALRALRLEAQLSEEQLPISCAQLKAIESAEQVPDRALLLELLGALAARQRSAPAADFAWWRRWHELRSLCAVRWAPVASVERVTYGHPYVYDLSVPGPQTFLAGEGGIFVHNTYTIANVIARVQRPAMVLAHNKTLAAQLYGEFREFFPHNAVEYFVSYYDYYQPEAYVPSSDTYIEKDSSVNEHIEQMRLSATKALLERSDSIIVATVSSIYGLGDPSAYLSMILHLVRGDRLDQRKLLRRLAEMQYTRNELDLTQGTYRVRGDVIDIFPAESEREAVRVELFDDTIESITLFDPLTGSISRKVPRFTVYPGTHYVTPRERLIGAVDQIRDDLAVRLRELREAGKLLEAQRLEQRTMFDMEMIKEVGYCAGIENYSRYLSGRAPGEPPPCLFDYLPSNALLVIDESHQTIPQLGAMYRGDRSRKEVLVEYGFRLPSALDNRPLKFEEWERLAPQMIFVSATPGPYEGSHAAQRVEQVVRPTGLVDPQVEVRPVGTQVDDVLSEIRACVVKGERVLITTLTKRMAEDLTEYLHEHDVRVRYLHSDIETVERTEIIRDLRLGRFDVLVGINLLREGLDMPEVSLVAILDADKEGFLRSDNSLIQTIGRAARNIHGRAILYADKMTGSMERAIEETNRRRQKQLDYNIAHGITPRGIRKGVTDIMEGARAEAPAPGRKKRGKEAATAALQDLRPETLVRQIKKLEGEMFKKARNLEFEEAAKLRDEIERLKQLELGFPARASG